MALLGGIVGGVIGAMFGGFWGAGLGAFIGLSLGGSDDAVRSTDDAGRDETMAAKMELLRTLIGLMAKMAKSDGRVSQEEANFVSQLLKSWDLTPMQRAELRDIFKKAKDSQGSYQIYADALARAVIEPAVRVELLRMLANFAIVDSELADSELEILRYTEAAMNLNGVIDAFFQRSQRRSDYGRATGGESRTSGTSFGNTKSELAQCYELLGCAPTASDSEVKKAYHAKCKEFHPDKVQALNLDASFVEFAKARMQAINQAYETIQAARR